MQNRKICGIVVTYKPSAEVLRNVQSIRKQVDSVIVVDNTPQPTDGNVLDALGLLDACSVIRNGKNLGIAAALNIGIRQAISNGFPWISTFDQDSRIRDGYFEAMLAALEQTRSRETVGMLCPRYEDARLGVFLPLPRDSDGDLLFCMTSGAMIRAETFRRFGPMEESFFIDYVDYEYCMRMRSKGLKVLECPGAILLHSLGNMTPHKIAGREMFATNHSPQRRYYINRNRIALIQRYALKHPAWGWMEVKGLLKDGVKVILLERDKIAKTRYALRGVVDALLGRMGPRVAL